MLLFITLSALIYAQMSLVHGSQSNYNSYNKQPFHNTQSQSFGHQSHQQQYKPQQQNHVAQQSSYQPNRNVIPITSYKNEVSHDGSYQYSYSTGNGIQADESGYLKNRGSQNQAQVAQGSYSYTAPNGQLIQVRYIADENGFRAEGNHLPKPPPIPVEIQKSLDLIARTQPAPATHNYQAFNQHSNQQQQYNQHHKYGK